MNLQTYADVPVLNSQQLVAKWEQKHESANRWDSSNVAIPVKEKGLYLLEATDGKIHTDSKDKIITVLLYLNDGWQEGGGRLRLLRNGSSLNDFAAEVPPDNGTLLIFKRSENSWHGHESFEGVRRSIQMNWMVSEGKLGFHKLRHQLSARLKKLMAH